MSNVSKRNKHYLKMDKIKSKRKMDEQKSNSIFKEFYNGIAFWRSSSLHWRNTQSNESREYFLKKAKEKRDKKGLVRKNNPVHGLTK